MFTFIMQRKLTTYNKEIRKAKRQNLRRFSENVTSTRVAARLHTPMGKTKTTCAIALKKPDDSYMEGETERAHFLLETHFSASKKTDREATIANTGSKREHWELARRLCIRKRMEWAINSLHTYKSPGAEGIFPILLQKVQEEVIQHLENQNGG